MSERVNAEAVEAQKRYGGSGGWDQATDEADALLRRAFIEGAQWFAAHEPARVAPSAEEVRAALMPESIRATQRTLYGEFSAPFISVDAAITVILALFARGETKGGE